MDFVNDFLVRLPFSRGFLLGALSHLRFLEVSKNSIKSLAPFRNHPALKSLYANDNPITDIQVLHTLTAAQQQELLDYERNTRYRRQ